MRLAGIEREWRVLDGTAVVDFRTVVDELPLDGRRLDPDDPHAHRCSWGGVVTADGKEAEVATPPRAAGPGVTWQLERLAATGLQQLRAACPGEWQLEGYSSHLNIGVDDRRVARTAERFARHLAQAQMLLLDRAGSPGLLVRPRRGRLELGGEYATGGQLRGALAFAIAGAVACERRAGPWRQVPAPSFTPQRAVGRFGWYVDRRATGTDLYTGGRSARLATDRGDVSAQSYLHSAWSALRDTAATLLDGSELALVDALVDGDLPLPLEAPEADPAPPVVTTGTPDPVLDDVERPGLVIRPVVARWDTCAFAADDGRVVTYVVVPAAGAAEFLADCAAGRYDERLSRTLSRGRLGLRRLQPAPGRDVTAAVAPTGAPRCA